MPSDARADILDIPGYEVLRPIGEGGMGAVYLARQVSLGRLVALKLLAIIPKADPDEQIARFRREAELMARIHHANVVSVHDFGIINGRPYLVMEYVEGGDLRRRMEPGRPLPVERVRPLVLPVTQALACLHAHGILHRDLKPENILMPDEVTPKLTDFGLAVLDSDIGTLTRADCAMGTIGYVAPEQQYRLGVDEQADQYSMAAVMYELLTGHRALGLLKLPSDFNPGLGPGVDAVLLRALQEDPDDRYPNVQEFGEALDRALGPRVRAARIHPWLVPTLTTTAVLALGALVAGTTGLWGRISAPAPAPAPDRTAAAVPAPSTAPASLINSVGMSLVLVPAGEFWMGAPDSDMTAEPDERPRHPVRIARPFYLGAHEVTVAAFRAFVAETRYQTEAESSGKGGTIYNSAAKRHERAPQYHWRNPGLALRQRDDEPVVQVSWNDATAFCRWLSGRENRPYRLPTEAEWEYACRAGSTTRWCMGDDQASLGLFAWVRDQDGYTTHPIGRKQPNAFGLYDMHGNVWEWCLDGYGPYPAGPVLDPLVAPADRQRVLRGGACVRGGIDRTSSSARLNRKPSYRYYKYGFRVCCPLTENEKAVLGDG